MRRDCRGRRRGTFHAEDPAQDCSCAKEPQPAEPADGKVTLADVLRAAGSSCGISPRSSSRPCGSPAPRRWCARAIRTRGVLPPGVFLPGASEADMLALTERVIVTALKDWNDFAANGMSLKIAVNVPVSALVKLPIARHGARAAPDGGELAGPDPGSDRGRDHPRPQARQRRRRASCRRRTARSRSTISAPAIPRSRGCKQLPFSELKIDRAYVINCHTDRVNAGLCEVFVELAKRFGLKTVAEGIETDAREPQAAGARLRRRAGLSVRQADVEGAADRRHAHAAWSARRRRSRCRRAGCRR